MQRCPSLLTQWVVGGGVLRCDLALKIHTQFLQPPFCSTRDAPQGSLLIQPAWAMPAPSVRAADWHRDENRSWHGRAHGACAWGVRMAAGQAPTGSAEQPMRGACEDHASSPCTARHAPACLRRAGGGVHEAHGRVDRGGRRQRRCDARRACEDGRSRHQGPRGRSAVDDRRDRRGRPPRPRHRRDRRERGRVPRGALPRHRRVRAERRPLRPAAALGRVGRARRPVGPVAARVAHVAPGLVRRGRRRVADAVQQGECASARARACTQTHTDESAQTRSTHTHTRTQASAPDDPVHVVLLQLPLKGAAR